MFGFFRFYLAWMVVITHISTVLGYVGGFAVYSFYILSGYLMTFIMNENYGYNLRGIKTYFINRFLRIFPPYWFVAALTLIGALLIPDVFYSMHMSLRTPITFHEVVSNFSIFGLFPGLQGNDSIPMARLVPAAWALHVELCFYLLIGLFLGRYKKLIVIWLAASIIYHGFALNFGWPRYAPIYAASLPFSLGAFLYHYRGVLGKFIPNNNAFTLLSLSIFILFNLSVGLTPITIMVYPFYINMIFTFILIFQLSQIKSRNYPSLKRIDSFLGDLSYPIYLSHWLLATLVGKIFGLDKSVLLFAVAFPFLVVFSIMMKFVIDDPVERVRRSIANKIHDGN